MYLRQGSLDMQLGVKEVAHTWTSHSPDWFDLDGNLLRYAQDKPDFSQAPDGADDFSTSMGRLVARLFLPVAILIGMLYVGLAVVSGAVVKNPLFIAALFPLGGRFCGCLLVLISASNTVTANAIGYGCQWPVFRQRVLAISPGWVLQLSMH